MIWWCQQWQVIAAEGEQKASRALREARYFISQQQHLFQQISQHHYLFHHLFRHLHLSYLPCLNVTIFCIFLAPFFMYGIPSNLTWDIFTPILQQSAFHRVEYCFLDHILDLSHSMLFVVLIMLHRRAMSSQSRLQHCNCDIYRSPSYKSDLHQYP